MFLIYNQKYRYASLLKKLYKVFACEENALCELCGSTCCGFVHNFNWKFKTLFFCQGWNCS